MFMVSFVFLVEITVLIVITLPIAEPVKLIFILQVLLTVQKTAVKDISH
jgi:hypothetical protein